MADELWFSSNVLTDFTTGPMLSPDFVDYVDEEERKEQRAKEQAEKQRIYGELGAVSTGWLRNYWRTAGRA